MEKGGVINNLFMKKAELLLVALFIVFLSSCKSVNCGCPMTELKPLNEEQKALSMKKVKKEQGTDGKILERQSFIRIGKK